MAVFLANHSRPSARQAVATLIHVAEAVWRSTGALMEPTQVYFQPCHDGFPLIRATCEREAMKPQQAALTKSRGRRNVVPTYG